MNNYAVIGAGFGDEGKGLAVDWLASTIQDKNILNVRFNGGFQAGHTVNTKDGTNHVFRGIGAGTLQNSECKKVDTYLAKEFILEPCSLILELNELRKITNHNFSVFVNSKCRITTVFDFSLNQAREYARDKKHGTCGLGIFETVKRDKIISVTLGDLYKDKNMLVSKLRNIAEYFINEMKSIGYTEDEAMDRIGHKEMDYVLEAIIKLLMDAKSCIVKIDDEASLIGAYKSIIFEGAQGLMLDMDNIEYMPNLTPSNTGLDNVVDILKNVGKDTDTTNITYITRSYCTRHGDGRLDNEVNKEELGEKVCDSTNIENQFQGKIRYGRLDIDTLLEAINKDFNKAAGLNGNIRKNILVTHLDQTEDTIITKYGSKDVSCILGGKFDTLYRSYGETADDVKE